MFASVSSSLAKVNVSASTRTAGGRSSLQCVAINRKTPFNRAFPAAGTKTVTKPATVSTPAPAAPTPAAPAPKKAATPVSGNPEYAGLSATQIEFMERKKKEAMGPVAAARAAKEASSAAAPVAAARAQTAAAPVAAAKIASSFTPANSAIPSSTTPASTSSTGEVTTKPMDLAVGIGAALLVGYYLITNPATTTL